MLLEDRIHIAAPPVRVFGFFDEMAERYLDWHPDHIAFEWRRGEGVAVGNRFWFSERIAGKVLNKHVVFTEVAPGRRMVFVPVNRLLRLFLPHFSFETRPEGAGTAFIARIVVRLGPLSAWLNRKELAAVRRHMREEGENLKAMMESAGTGGVSSSAGSAG